MKSLKVIFHICIQNLRKWQKDYRIYIIGILLFLLVFDNTRSFKNMCDYLKEPASIWFYPFLYTQYHQKLIFTIPLLLLFSNAPFIDSNAMYIISRCRKSEWHLGQFLYIIISSVLYYLYIFVCSVLLLLPTSEISSEWGKGLKTISVFDINHEFGYNFINVPKFTINYFTPLQAVWFTFLLSVMTAIMLGMIIYFLNTITNTNYIGSVVSSIIIIFSCFAETFFNNASARWYSPVTWITVDKLDVGGLTNNPTFTYCVTVLISVTVFIGLLTVLFRKAIKLDINQR